MKINKLLEKQNLDILLTEAECIYIDYNDILKDKLRMKNGKSPLRIKIEKFEKDINRIWIFVLCKYRKKHVYDLPKPIYNWVILYMRYKGKKLLNELLELAKEWMENVQEKYKEPFNPYIVGIYCLIKKYNILENKYAQNVSGKKLLTKYNKYDKIK